MTTFRVAATQHAPNYFPLYLALRKGYFAQEGLDLEIIAPPDWTDVLVELDHGRADLALGGLWVPAMYFGHGRDYSVVGALNSRNPKVLVMRAPNRDFSWRDLEGKIVLAPGGGGTAPYVHTAGLMRKAGVDMCKVRWVRDLSGPVMTELFLGGHGDAIVLDAVKGTLLEHTGQGYIVARHDVDGGPMPNSVFYTLKERVAQNDDVWRFMRALHRAYAWLRENSAVDAEDELAAEFPDIDTRELIGIVDELRTRNMWEDIRVDPNAYVEWLRIQQDDGLIDDIVPYDELIDSRPAVDAVRRFSTAE